ncbi:MAG: DUF4287 domain-containing protein [Xanthomonadales bacterium]|nr:DUF4287 domain-containing protein [Xanthomonadales bacterium]
MADPNAALQTQLSNIQNKTGKTLEQIRALLEATGLSKHGEQREHLMETLGIGFGDANTVIHVLKQAAAPAPASDDPLDLIYVGAKAHLRPLHEALMKQIDAFGEFERAPKKTYISLRRKKQFAMLGPATKTQVELGLNVKELPHSARLKVMPPASMCQYSLRLSDAAEIDAELIAWVRKAFDSAG